LGDEFCPDYCDTRDRERLAAADRIEIVNGLLLTSADEVGEHRRTGRTPEAALAMERRRQQALWRWYRYVVDYAMARDHVDVAVYELRAAHDDLITGSSEEHKLAAAIVERDLALRGFRQLTRQAFGPANEPEHLSFVIYELAVEGSCPPS
jgi:hypothetical protein